jgi:hypothetical protein
LVPQAETVVINIAKLIHLSKKFCMVCTLNRRTIKAEF